MLPKSWYLYSVHHFSILGRGKGPVLGICFTSLDKSYLLEIISSLGGVQAYDIYQPLTTKQKSVETLLTHHRYVHIYIYISGYPEMGAPHSKIVVSNFKMVNHDLDD